MTFACVSLWGKKTCLVKMHMYIGIKTVSKMIKKIFRKMNILYNKNVNKYSLQQIGSIWGGILLKESHYLCVNSSLVWQGFMLNNEVLRSDPFGRWNGILFNKYGISILFKSLYKTENVINFPVSVKIGIYIKIPTKFASEG